MTDFLKQYKKVLEYIELLIKKTNKHAVLIIQQRPNEQDKEPVVPMVRESLSNLIAFVCVAQANVLEDIVRNAKGVIDTIIFDNVIKRSNSDSIVNELYSLAKQYEIPVLTYNDFDSWVSSAINVIKSNEKSSLENKDILILGKNYLATRIILQLIDCNANIYLLKPDYENFNLPYIHTTSLIVNSSNLKIVDKKQKFDLLLGCCLHNQYNRIHGLIDYHFGSIYDVGVSNFSEEFLTANRLKGCQNIYRSDDRAGIASVVLNLMETNYLLHHCMGRKSVTGINMVAGGIVGDYGDVVIDSIENPRQVLGIANGDGTFKQHLSEIDIKNIEKVKTILS